MSDRKWTIVLGGLVALASACKDDAGTSPSPESKPTEASGTEAKGTDEKAIEPAKPAAPPVEPPPLGHAVARVGGLLFFSSTSDVGFELPPLGTAPGMTVDVVGAQDGRLVIETLVSEPVEHHCTATLDGLADFRLRLYLAESDLLPVLTTELEHAFADGTKARVARGVPVPAGSTELVALGTAIRVPVPAERLGRAYEPGQPFAREGSDGTLYPLEGHALTYDGRTLDEQGLYRDGGNVTRFGATERTSDALVTVRNPCLEVTALASTARLHAPPVPGGIIGAMAAESGHFLASPYGAAFATGTDDEDVWGGLSGTEIGETYGVGGLGLVGTGRSTEKRYEVKPGTAILWADGRAAGQVTAGHRFAAPPRDEGGRSCFDAPILAGGVTTVTLCFAPGDVGEIEVPVSVGTIGSGSGLGEGVVGGVVGGVIGGVPGGSGSSTGSGFGSRGSGSKGAPRVRQSKAEVKGSLDKDIIRRIVRAHINEVRYCYNQGLARDPALAGKVSIQFTIGASGSVSAVTVTDSTVADENVSKCIAKAVKRWTFPKPEGGVSVVVTYPFVLEPG